MAEASVDRDAERYLEELATRLAALYGQLDRALKEPDLAGTIKNEAQHLFDQLVEQGFYAVVLPIDLQRDLDNWIAAHPIPKPSRPEAIRRLLRDHLIGLGRVKSGKDPDLVN